MEEVMATDRPQTKRGQIVFVGSKGSGKSSLYQCLKSLNQHVSDVPSCSVLVEEWKPFDAECSPVAEECRKCLEEELGEEDLKTVFQVWDICGHESLWTCQQLCISKAALFVLVFNVRNPMDAGIVPQWVQMIQAKSCGAHIIIAASNCEILEDSCQSVVQEVEKVENAVVGKINEEIAALRDLKSDDWVRKRIEKLEKIVEKRPNVCSTVFMTSAVTGKGVSELRCAILKHLFDFEKSPHVHRSLGVKEMDFVEKVCSLHDGKNMVMSLKNYREIAATVGLNDEEELEQATEALEMKGRVARVKVAGKFEQPDTTIIITDPCCFANACVLIHRDEETPQDFVNELQRSHLVQRFWPTSTRPNDWTLRSAIEDVVDRGMIRESFLPLCWQVWDVDEGDIKKLLPAMIKLGILIDGAPKAGYEIELALSYFKNLSVTKRYHLPLLLKLPKTVSQAVWPETAPESTVTVGWQYQFQQGTSEGLLLSILAACVNFTPQKTLLAHWRTGVIVRIGDVDVRLVINTRVLDLHARCKITSGNKRALNMAWMTLAHYLYVTESFLSNFPGLYYQFASPLSVHNSPKTIYQLIHDYMTKIENHFESLWILPPFDLSTTTGDELSIPSDVLTWMRRLSGQSSIYISHANNVTDEVKQLAANLEQFGFDVVLREHSEEASDKKHTIQHCLIVILFLTKTELYKDWNDTCKPNFEAFVEADIHVIPSLPWDSYPHPALAVAMHGCPMRPYLEDATLQEDIAEAQNNNKHIIAARFEGDLVSELANVVWADLDNGTGSGISHVFNAEQLKSLITECHALLYGSGDIEPLSESPTEPETRASSDSAPPLPRASMEAGKPSQSEQKNDSNLTDEARLKKAEKKKRQVQFSPETADNGTADRGEDQIRSMAACTVAAAMVGAAAEHLSRSGKASPSSVRAASATAKVARAVANGDADAATEAMNNVVRIVHDLASSSKQKENGFVPPPKSKTCVIL